MLMLRIVERMWVKPIDEMPNVDWIELSFVPATAVISIEHSLDGAGRLTTYELSAKVPKLLPIFDRNLMVKMRWDNNIVVSIGRIDLPVRFDVSETDSITISTKYQCRPDYNTISSF